MDWTEPASVVMSRGAAAVLRVLARADGSFSVRELARVAAISPSRARQVVERLSAHGLLTVDHTAGAQLVSLNRDHVAAEPSIALATLRMRILDRLRHEFDSWSIAPLHVSMYGSAARGDGDPQSDIDLLAIHAEFPSPDVQDKWDDQLAGSADLIHRFTGNWVGWFQASNDDVARMTVSREPIVAEWRRDSITLFGPPLATFLRGRK
jgi:predicted nucleotidyltransferase